mmetsp:Transcript_20812/g.67006  ORF Transcript_20812/g.67006 Transcript_20812/m.67006 type:complete len:257 (-) Transcript_20812:328-1098(-)
MWYAMAWPSSSYRPAFARAVATCSFPSIAPASITFAARSSSVVARISSWSPALSRTYSNAFRGHPRTSSFEVVFFEVVLLCFLVLLLLVVVVVGEFDAGEEEDDNKRDEALFRPSTRRLVSAKTFRASSTRPATPQATMAACAAVASSSKRDGGAALKRSRARSIWPAFPQALIAAAKHASVAVTPALGMATSKSSTAFSQRRALPQAAIAAANAWGVGSTAASQSGSSSSSPLSSFSPLLQSAGWAKRSSRTLSH